MALNCSPESKSSNPKPRSAELFGTCGHHLSNSEELNYAIHCTKFQIFFFILPMYFYFQTQGLQSGSAEDFDIFFIYFHGLKIGPPSAGPSCTQGPSFEQT